MSERWSIKRICRERGFARNTVRAAIRSERPPAYVRSGSVSKLDAFGVQIEELLAEDARVPGEVILERLREAGYAGSRTILNDLLRELRPRFAPARTFQRTRYEPGQVCQFDLWHVTRPVPVGCGQERRAYVVCATLGYSRASAGALVFSREAPDVLWGIQRCLWRLGGLPRRLVWDREGCLHAGLGRATDAYAALLGELGVGAVFCRERDRQAKGAVERFQGYLETSFEPARRFVNEHDFQAQLDAWVDERANQRLHRTLRQRPIELLGEEQAAMAPLPLLEPNLERRATERVGQDPYLRFDTCDYSLDPRLVGQRIEMRISQTRILAVSLATGEIAADHRRSYAKHRTITDARHAEALAAMRAERLGAPTRPSDGVQRRDLAAYDALIPA
ncbi:MAG: IS21 family transposase [Actinomycetota bacterium]|nr:IS21 family transposase [Actinomycetota bacterium]